jgi:hypothetical protein
LARAKKQPFNLGDFLNCFNGGGIEENYGALSALLDIRFEVYLRAEQEVPRVHGFRLIVDKPVIFQPAAPLTKQSRSLSRC